MFQELIGSYWHVKNPHVLSVEVYRRTEPPWSEMTIQLDIKRCGFDDWLWNMYAKKTFWTIHIIKNNEKKMTRIKNYGWLMGSTISRFTKRPLFKGDPTWLIIFGQTARNDFLSTIEFSLGTDFFSLCCGCERSKRSTSWPLSVRNSRILWCCQQMNRTKPFVQVFVAWWSCATCRMVNGTKHASLGGLLSLFVMIPPSCTTLGWAQGIILLSNCPVFQSYRGVQFQGCHRKPQAAVANLRVWQSTVAGGGASENRMWPPGVFAAMVEWWLNDGWMMVEWYLKSEDI